MPSWLYDSFFRRLLDGEEITLPHGATLVYEWNEVRLERDGDVLAWMPLNRVEEVNDEYDRMDPVNDTQNVKPDLDYMREVLTVKDQEAAQERAAVLAREYSALLDDLVEGSVLYFLRVGRAHDTRLHYAVVKSGLHWFTTAKTRTFLSNTDLKLWLADLGVEPDTIEVLREVREAKLNELQPPIDVANQE